MPEAPAEIPRDISRLPKTDPIVAEIAREWRELTSGHSRRSGRRLGAGEPTLVACSGGADSSALAIALASVTGHIVLGHVIHDMRPRADAMADRDAVKSLADHLAVPFTEAAVSVHLTEVGTERDKHARIRPNRNIEQVARRRRYEALVQLADKLGISYIATAHHADDQLETLLMRLMRGSGPTGLRGIARRRRLCSPPIESKPNDDSRWLIRPMLGVTRADAERICRVANWTWCTDATNADLRRVRSNVRANVVPALLAIEPKASQHAAQAASLLAELGSLADDIARELDRTARINTASGTSSQPSTEITWNRDTLREARPVILSLLLRRAIHQCSNGAGIDQTGFSVTRRIVSAIRGDSPDPRRFVLRHTEINVTSKLVHIRRRDA